MEEYHKIQTVYKRNPETKFKTLLGGEYALLEFEYLANNEWIFTEKVNGTNIRVEWKAGFGIKIGGRTDTAQIPTFLYDRVNLLLPAEKFEKSIELTDSLVLYGEGYGAKIQKGGGNYKPDGVDFVLFDVLVDGWWLKREDVEDVAERLGIKAVPVIGYGTLPIMVDLVKDGVGSRWGDFQAEGIVARPTTELFNRNRHRIITKIKHKDFPK